MLEHGLVEVMSTTWLMLEGGSQLPQLTAKTTVPGKSYNFRNKSMVKAMENKVRHNSAQLRINKAPFM